MTSFYSPICIVNVRVTYCCNGVLCNDYCIFQSNTLLSNLKNVKCISLLWRVVEMVKV